MIAALAFYLFAAILLASAVMVVSARHPVHAVLFLILAFFNAAALFLLAGAEFLAMILVIVYVGAVAVLFLFVVMMLDVNFAQMREGFQRYTKVGTVVGLILLVELALVLSGWSFAAGSAGLRFAPIAAGVTNTVQLGKLLYTDYVLLFQAAGLVLLVAMIGAIVLTLRGKTDSRRQSIAHQLARSAAETMVMIDVRSGAGVKELGILRPPAAEPAPVAAPHGAAHEDAHGGGHH
jgi:NADH-quinone oxidoreductase subunit J